MSDSAFPQNHQARSTTLDFLAGGPAEVHALTTLLLAFIIIAQNHPARSTTLHLFTGGSTEVDALPTLASL